MLKTTDYISTITHEIRNPLTLVYGTLQLIESKHPEVTHFEHWSDLHQDIDYMIHLLDELSSFNNRNRLQLKTIDSGYFFKKTVLSFASSIIHQRIEFISCIQPNLPPIQCDEIKLKEVLLNLLFNSRDALFEALEKNTCFAPFIRLSVSSDCDTLRIVIEDNGCGISKEHLDHIFEPFVTYKKHGTGLGLAIAAGIISSHNGTIHVSSVPDTGTTFTLTLPVKQNT